MWKSGSPDASAFFRTNPTFVVLRCLVLTLIVYANVCNLHLAHAVPYPDL